MVKHTQTICLQQPTNCLSGFDHFVRLALKGLNLLGSKKIVLKLEVSQYFPIQRSESLLKNFRIPVLISTPASYMFNRVLNTFPRLSNMEKGEVE